MGRPQIEGERLQNLWVMAENPKADWMPTTLIDWYSSGLPAVALRWVFLIRDPLDEFGTRALLCADLGVQPQQIIGWFIGRRRMASDFQEVRQRLDLETQRQWSELATEFSMPDGHRDRATVISRGLRYLENRVAGLQPSAFRTCQ